MRWSTRCGREDFLAEAWRRVRRNGGSAGVDGETFTDIERYGVARWLGELARDLRDGAYAPKPVLQVLIPKKQPGEFRPLGIPCIRDRVAQTSALLVLEPIFEADLQPEQYAYRPGRSAHDAVRRVHSLLNTGHNEVVQCDLSNYFGEIPHAELLKSFARRIGDGRMLKLIKAWLEMPVEEDDGEGGKRRTNRASRERKGTPQGSPISPLASNLYMRRLILGWKVLGQARDAGRIGRTAVGRRAKKAGFTARRSQASAPRAFDSAGSAFIGLGVRAGVDGGHEGFILIRFVPALEGDHSAVPGPANAGRRLSMERIRRSNINISSGRPGRHRGTMRQRGTRYSAHFGRATLSHEPGRTGAASGNV